MEYFFDKIEFSNNGCWNWVGDYWANSRYGVIRSPITKKSYSAHRVSYLMFNGVPKDGLVICHRCDNTKCVNPSHLFEGTRSDNMLDASHKKRLHSQQPNAQKGENNRNAKFTKEFADKIRDYYSKNSVSYSELAKYFNLKSKGHAYNIIANKIWT